MIKNLMDLPPVVDVSEMGKALGISRSLAYVLIKQESFPAVRVGKRRIIIPRDRLIEWLDENAEKAI